MPYFHVLVKIDSVENEYEQILTDITETDLKDKFVDPYNKSQDILINGRVIRIDNIEMLCIARTKEKNEVTREKINEDSLDNISRINSKSDGVVFLSAGSGYDPEDLFDMAEDVTTEYINGPPGNQLQEAPISQSEQTEKPENTKSKIAVITSHPLLVTVVGGIIVAALAALFGLG